MAEDIPGLTIKMGTASAIEGQPVRAGVFIDAEQANYWAEVLSKVVASPNKLDEQFVVDFSVRSSLHMLAQVLAATQRPTAEARAAIEERVVRLLTAVHQEKDWLRNCSTYIDAILLLIDYPGLRDGYGAGDFKEVGKDKQWLLTLPDSLERAHLMTTLDILTAEVRAARRLWRE